MTLDDVASSYNQESLLNHMRRRFINYVPGFGVDNPDVLVVGEAPGKFENLHKKPFVGPAGKLLKEFLTIANLSPLTNCYLTNIVKYRPIDNENNNRTPNLREIQISVPYLWKEWRALNRPQVIIPVGSVAMNAIITANKTKILTCQGQPFVERDFIAVPMVHPAYILRNEATIGTYRASWQQLGQWLESNSYLSRLAI